MRSYEPRTYFNFTLRRLFVERRHCRHLLRSKLTHLLSSDISLIIVFFFVVRFFRDRIESMWNVDIVCVRMKCHYHLNRILSKRNVTVYRCTIRTPQSRAVYLTVINYLVLLDFTLLLVLVARVTMTIAKMLASTKHTNAFSFIAVASS